MKRIDRIIYFVLSLCTFVCSCSDDEDFSLSPYNILTLEADTVSLDTCFSTIPSPHKIFKIYNNSSENIRISNVKLSRGNQTGFRVNVNGSYLGDANGFQTRDIELRSKDSIRVFVELTAKENGDSIPVKVDDNLVLTLESGVVQKVNLNAWSWDAVVLRDYYVGGDTITKLNNIKGKPTIVYGKIFVDSLAVLEIQPGTTLFFHNNAGIEVKGKLHINGEKEKEVTLRSDRLDWMVSNLTYDNNPGQWGGISFLSSSYDNKITYTDIHACSTAITCDSSSNADRMKLQISNSTLHNMKGYGIKTIASNISMENTQVSNAYNDCINILGGNIDINQCTIVQYYPFDARRGSALTFANGLEEKSYPLSMTVNNSIIKGYADDVVFWSHGDTEDPLDVTFANCIVRTTPGDDYEYMFTDCIIEDDATDTLTSARNSFVLFDTENFFYDFTPKKESKAIGIASKETSLPYDRRGKVRDANNPDIGCFETDKEIEEQHEEN